MKATCARVAPLERRLQRSACGDNVGEDRVAFSGFQTCAMRHAIHDLRPIFGPVTPERRQRMAFNATVNEKRSTLLERPQIDMLLRRIPFPFRSHGRRRFPDCATAKTDNENNRQDQDRNFLHFRDRPQKSCGLAHPARSRSAWLARAPSR